MQFACARQEVHHHEQQKWFIKVLAAFCDYGTWVLNSSRKRNPIWLDRNNPIWLGINRRLCVYSKCYQCPNNLIDCFFYFVTSTFLISMICRKSLSKSILALELIWLSKISFRNKIIRVHASIIIMFLIYILKRKRNATLSKMVIPSF